VDEDNVLVMIDELSLPLLQCVTRKISRENTRHVSFNVKYADDFYHRRNISCLV